MNPESIGPPGQYAFSFLMKGLLYGSTEQCHMTMWWQWDGFFDPHFGSLKSPWRQISRQGGKTHPFHELCGPIVHRKERLSWVKTFIPFGFLTVVVTWPAASRSSCSNFLATMDHVPRTCESEWALSYVAFATERRTVAETDHHQQAEEGDLC